MVVTPIRPQALMKNEPVVDVVEACSDKHQDLAQTCLYLHDLIDAKHAAACRQLLAISHNVERMIEGGTKAERLASARLVLSEH